MPENHSGHSFTCQICRQAYAGARTDHNTAHTVEGILKQLLVLAEQCENDPLPDAPA